MAKKLEILQLLQFEFNILAYTTAMREWWNVDSACFVLRLADIRSSSNIYIKYESPLAWDLGVDKDLGEVVWGTDDELYTCSVAHTTANNDKPITGPDYLDFWKKLLS